MHSFRAQILEDKALKIIHVTPADEGVSQSSDEIKCEKTQCINHAIEWISGLHL